MRQERENFSALSLDVGSVLADRKLPITDSPPRLTPVSVRGFNVQPTGLENRDLPETDQLATTRHWQGRQAHSVTRKGGSRE